MEFLTRSWAVLESSWAAWGWYLGRRGSFGQPQEGAMAAQGPPAIGAMQSGGCGPEGGPLEDYRNLPDRPWHSSTPQRAQGTVADYLVLHIASIRIFWFCLDLYCCIALPCICFAKFCLQCFALHCTCIWIPCQYVALHCHCVDSSPSTVLHCFALGCRDVALSAVCLCSVRVFIRRHLMVKPVVGKCSS